MIAHLVVGIACLTLAVAVPIATVAILAGDGALHRQAIRARRCVARWVRGPFGQHAPSPAHPAVKALLAQDHPAGNGQPLSERELAVYMDLIATEFPERRPASPPQTT